MNILDEHHFKKFFHNALVGISAHKGRLWAQNRKEKGASFYFTLPACPNG